MNKKVLKLEQIVDIVYSAKKNDKIIVTTNGCFDILHIGHIKYLREAKLLGDILAVGINSDLSVKELKGEKRPINSQDIRAEMLAAISFVDYVFVFNEKDPCVFLEKIKPHYHVKGGDYTNKLIEQDVVEKNGGKIKILNMVRGYSTSQLIERIKRL